MLTDPGIVIAGVGAAAIVMSLSNNYQSFTPLQQSIPCSLTRLTARLQPQASQTSALFQNVFPTESQQRSSRAVFTPRESLLGNGIEEWQFRAPAPEHVTQSVLRPNTDPRWVCR